MTNSFEMLNTHDKMVAWRDFRTELSEIKDDFDLLLKVQSFWEQLGRVRWCLDYDHPHTWITPWELISENTYCRSSLAYMMYWTIHHSDPKRWPQDRLELKLVQENMYNEEFIVVIVDGTYVLNLSYGDIVDCTTKDYFDIKQSYAWDGRQFNAI